MLIVSLDFSSAELLGLPLLPSHNDATGDAALHGVNYASAAAGILDNTGQNFVRTCSYQLPKHACTLIISGLTIPFIISQFSKLISNLH
jgi:hypothetical protein